SKQVYFNFKLFSKRMFQIIRRNFSVLYILFFVISFFLIFFKTIFEFVLVALFFIVGIVNLFLFFKFNSFLNTTFLEAILFTTISETKEFISSYFDFKIICILSGFLFLV
ncbi:hypothetical protein FT533_08575, partial [Campylobacter coli]|nr:hypothetical protein [Campylobacter coli]ECO2116793.1 hypothetical protein [Campylobacter coli]